ncbi:MULTISPECIES: hypothetical protein [unclassified Yoonia]|uniref:hypothetical protein n=1 Tax=unclassified Yoonia TaxID=2629118 RepID=UPI002AFDD7A1|nr:MULTISPECIES: hypothetical protein [unclassified Yoonia]
MIYPLAGLLIGAIVGAWRAKANGGRGLDMAQWGAGFGIAFGLVGLFVLIFLERSML